MLVWERGGQPVQIRRNSQVAVQDLCGARVAPLGQILLELLKRWQRPVDAHHLKVPMHLQES